MATKCYLPRIAQTTPISPSISTGWLSAPALIRANLKTTSGSDANATITVTEITSTLALICAAQYIAPLKAGQTITGAQAIQFVCQFQESTSNNNMNSAFGIRILDSTGTIERKVLRAPTAEVLEFVVTPTVHTNRNNTGTSAAGNYTTVDGDYLVVEIGAGGDPSGSNPHTYSLRLGNSTATFLTANDTGTSSTDNNSPWVQLADTLVLEPSMTTPTIASGAVLNVMTVGTASPQTVTPDTIASGAATFAASVTPGAVTLTPGTIAATSLFAPTVTPQSVTLTGAFKSSSAALHTPVVSQLLALVITNDGVIIPTTTLYSPTLSQPFQGNLTGTWRQEVIAGADGNRTIFSVQSVPQSGSLFIFINGFDQTDYTLVGTTITFGIAPRLGDIIVACYCSVAFPSWRRDPLTGANGANNDFVLPVRPQANSLLAMLNGFFQRDYTQSGRTITFNTAPSTGDDLVASYVT